MWVDINQCVEGLILFSSLFLYLFSDNPDQYRLAQPKEKESLGIVMVLVDKAKPRKIEWLKLT